MIGREGLRLDATRVAIAALLLFYIGVEIRWVALYRRGGLLDIDEAGFLAIAFKDYLALRAEGWLAWLAAIVSPSQQAPLTTALTSLLFAAFGPHIVLGFAVPVAAMIVTIIATYFLARSLAGNPAGVLSAALVATTPLLVNFSRDFQFGVVATSITTLALLALVGSDRLGKWPAAIAFGVLVGLMPLARTMTIAFVPGLLLAAGAAALSAQEGRLMRLARLTVGGTIAAGVAASWLWFNGDYVAHYLLDAGYGARAVEYGRARGPTEAITARLLRLVQAFNLPIAMVITLGLIFGLGVILVAMAAKPDRRRNAARLLGSPIATLAIFSVCGLLALASSQNVGAAFEAPLLPPICVMAVMGLLAVARRPVATAFVQAIVSLAALVVFVPLIDLGWPLARPVVVALPYVGAIAVTNGRGIEQLYETGKGLNDKNPGGPLPVAVAQGWWGLYALTASKILAAAGDHLVAYGMRGVMYNINTVELASLATTGRSIKATQISPIETGAGVAGYTAWLATGEAAAACVLLTSRGTEGELAPPPDTPNLEQAAQLSGFTVKDSWPTPSGRTVEMWVRSCR
ncbi:MAG: glycosyltransferase family 39 protein [Devosia sp.]|nr:glycosyltransferase family 39 protein [Devosia sp.]